MRLALEEEVMENRTILEQLGIPLQQVKHLLQDLPLPFPLSKIRVEVVRMKTDLLIPSLLLYTSYKW